MTVSDKQNTPQNEDWRCECGDLNRWHESFCYRCGAGQPDDDSTPIRPDEFLPVALLGDDSRVIVPEASS